MFQNPVTSKYSEYRESQNDPSQPESAGPGGMRFVRSFWALLLARQGIIAYLPILAAVLLLFYGASGQIFAKYADATHYQCYALIFWQGSQGTRLLPGPQCSFLYQLGMSQGNVPAFHIVPFEYPPLTLSIFSLALVAPIPYYQVTFAILMALMAILIYWLLQRYGPRGSGLACALYLVLGCWATAESRFDLVPAGLTLLSLIAAERRRWTLASIALAFACLLKIYPLLLLPALFLAEQIATERIHRPSASLTLKTLPTEIWRTLHGARQWRWRNALLFFSLVVVISGLFALLNFQGALVSQLSYFADRPIQIESTGSTLLWLATLIGHPASVVYTFSSYNIVSNLDSAVALAFEALFVLGYTLAILREWRGKLDVTQTFLVLILVFVVTSKVFSPQYLIWLIPLLAYNGAFRWRWLALWGGISLLTTIIYPYYYTHDSMLLAPSVPGFIEVVALRNLLLALAALALICNWPLPGRPDSERAARTM